MSLARSIGEFVGHIWRGVTADVSAETSNEKRELKQTVEERQAQASDGRTVTLRRTTIDEVEVREDR